MPKFVYMPLHSILYQALFLYSHLLVHFPAFISLSLCRSNKALHHQIILNIWEESCSKKSEENKLSITSFCPVSPGQLTLCHKYSFSFHSRKRWLRSQILDNKIVYFTPSCLHHHDAQALYGCVYTNITEISNLKHQQKHGSNSKNKELNIQQTIYTETSRKKQRFRDHFRWW